MIWGLNWLDIIIIIVFVLYAFEGIAAGFISSLFDFFSFIMSFILGISFYSKIASILVNNFSISLSIANAIGFFLVALVIQILTSILLGKNFQERYKSYVFGKMGDKLNRAFGFLPAFLSAFILLAFLLSLVISLPLSPFLKKSISASRLGNIILSQTQGFEGSINAIFGGAIQDTLNFLTVKPQSSELVKLNFKTTDIQIDLASEKKMLEMVNKARVNSGLSSLINYDSLKEVARIHAKDMLERGYFSHYTPEGLSPFDRMGIYNISFIHAGENLAFSPNVDLAMQGLMKSKGHRENILSQSFGKVGIGVIDAGVYGEVFVQEFTN